MSEDSPNTNPMAPGAEHRRLHAFLGTFRAEVRLWTGEAEPVVSTGTMVNTLELEGRYLRQDYRGDPAAGPFAAFVGHGYWGFNPVSGAYEGFWIDNASTMMQFETGTVNEAGTVWTMHGSLADPAGGVMAKRSVITLQDEDHHTMESFFSRQGQEFKAMEIRYQRVE